MDKSTHLHKAVGEDITPERLQSSFKLTTSSFVQMRWFTVPSQGWVRIECRNMEDQKLVWRSLFGRSINGVKLGSPVSRNAQSMVREGWEGKYTVKLQGLRDFNDEEEIAEFIPPDLLDRLQIKVIRDFKNMEGDKRTEIEEFEKFLRG